MKYIVTSLIFNFLFLSSFSQSKKNDLTVFANTGFVIGGQGYLPGIGGGLQLGYGKEKGSFIVEGSYTFFGTKDDVFNNRYDRGWLVLRPGYNFKLSNYLYAQLNAGAALETGSQGIEGYGAVLGTGLGYKPKAGNGNIDVFTKFNLLLGRLSNSHYFAIGIGYAIPLSSTK